MSARFTLYGFLLVLILLVSGCSKDDMVNEAISDLNAVTDDIVKIVHDGQDKKAAIAEAQAKLDEFAPKWEPVKDVANFQINEETKKKLGESLQDNTLKMASLELDLAIASATDPELAAAVEKLTSGYQALVTGE
jgi:hypothetical protein